MRKICISILAIAILLMVSYSFGSETPRAQTSSSGKSGLTNVSVVGLENDGSTAITDAGTPGYIEMTNSAGDVFYLWVGFSGNLLISSAQEVGLTTSPATVAWADTSGVAVGVQALP